MPNRAVNERVPGLCAVGVKSHADLAKVIVLSAIRLAGQLHHNPEPGIMHPLP